ncbi:hypothetical protein HUJ04_002468 [Dendroctonus ponderosae]|nr:hypothetical protein HUJ04_002468 [Dendroctonus ponderosae]
MVRMFSKPGMPVDFFADHPFLFYLAQRLPFRKKHVLCKGKLVRMRCLPFVHEFTADHPFILALVATQENIDMVLFSGRVMTIPQ